MKIKKIISQHRRDFQAIYVCEHCGGEEKGSGYDNRNFHQNVIPGMVCRICEKSSPKEYVPLITKYPEGTQV